MKSFDALVVGGGPAGSSCARRLVEGGLRVAVLDRESFPRTKLCAGWITPEVLDALKFTPRDYPYRFNTFDHLVVHIKGLTFRVKTVQHSIRRYEFDDWLVKSSGAELILHNVRDVQKTNGAYTVDDAYRAQYLVGSGGTRCPVYRSIFRASSPRPKDLQVVAYEQEFPFAWKDPCCHLWFFDHGLPGYAWYVPKADGYLNCGLGAMADRLKERGEDIQEHWRHFVRRLDAAGLVSGVEFAPRGYSYYLRGGTDSLRAGNAFLVGDAAGMSTVDLGEGIGPAVKSGKLAAQAIISGGEYVLSGVETTSADRIVEGPILRRLVRAALATRDPGRAANRSTH